MQIRLARLRKFLEANQLEAVVISSLQNITYFSGFRGDDSFLLVTPQNAALITDFRYIEQAQKQAPVCQIVEHKGSLYEAVAALCKAQQLTRIGFEGAYLAYNQYTDLVKALKMSPMPVVLEDLREVKDESELIKLKKAVAISDAAFTRALEILRPGITELEVAAELEDVMRRLGSERPAFATIVASGVRGSLPHGLATSKVIEAGDLVTMDFGAVYEGYHSDITRTVCVGASNAKQREIYHTVLEAQILGTKTVKAGLSGVEVDAVVRKYITDAGYGKYFGHGLGHGVGLAIHEQPRLAPKSVCQSLQAGMAVTVEPGIYLPEWGGVRIEDTVIVTNDGCDILTASDKRLIEITNS